VYKFNTEDDSLHKATDSIDDFVAKEKSRSENKDTIKGRFKKTRYAKEVASKTP